MKIYPWIKHGLFGSATLLLIYSCSTPEKKQEEQSIREGVEVPDTQQSPIPARKDTFTKSVLIQSVSANQNPAIRYALYLPHQYAESIKLPVLIFFDPHGEGVIPLFKYSSLSEKYGFVLMGSNTVRNGMTFEETGSIINGLVEEAKSRFRADPERISLAGFSGGAKAVLFALPNMLTVSSVIYCGAALPTSSTILPPALGIAGVKDMNYTEVLEMDDALEKANRSHAVVEWNGKHEWCDNSTFENAFSWVIFRAMEKKSIAKDDNLIRNFLSANSAGSGNPLIESKRLKKIIFFLRGIEDMSTWQAKLQSLQKRNDYLTAEARQKEELEVEARMKQNYVSLIGSKDAYWWLGEIKRLRSDPKNASNHRILGYISLACYSMSSRELKEKNYPKAEKALTVYGIVDPDNVDRAYLQASYYGYIGNNTSSVQFLRNAVNYGFRDRNKLMQDEAFASIRNTEEFNKVLNDIRPADLQ